MIINQQTAGGGDERNSENDLSVMGVFNCKLDAVKDLPPPKANPDWRPRVVFEFVVIDGPQQGKRTASVMQKNLFLDKKSNKKSRLYEFAQGLGVIDPLAGFDTDAFLGRFFQVMTKLDEKGRAWPSGVVPIAAPPGAMATPQSQSSSPRSPSAPSPGPSSPGSPAPTPTSEQFEVWTGQAWEQMTRPAVQEWMNKNSYAASTVHVRRPGGQAVMANAFGFADPIPF